jgi:DNA-directed RNA polymerase specialized sigma24 family protein
VPKSQLVSEEDIRAWLMHPVTRAFASRLREQREEIKEMWACGTFVDDTEFKTAVKEAAAHRHCEVLKTLLELEEGDLSYVE